MHFKKLVQVELQMISQIKEVSEVHKSYKGVGKRYILGNFVTEVILSYGFRKLWFALFVHE
jgi:hypothetical protein